MKKVIAIAAAALMLLTLLAGCGNNAATPDNGDRQRCGLYSGKRYTDCWHHGF